ncbi:MAG: pyrimidine reductase family protein [Acidimicrobiales bacterium]|nr:pyrimidine reductase family protein [Acidimicrobiales bacterium]
MLSTGFELSAPLRRPLPTEDYGHRVQRIYPEPTADLDPTGVYFDDDRPAPPGRPWVVTNMVASVDGATAVDGQSGNLGGPADRQIFKALRGCADMILVGAGTVRAEKYRPPRSPAEPIAVRRAARGQATRPRLVVISASLNLNPEASLFVDRDPEDPPPIVATVTTAPASRWANLDSVADVVACGETQVDLNGLLAVLDDLGAHTVLCEGGPDLNHQLFASGLVDELCLSVSPQIIGGVETNARSLLTGPVLSAATRLRLDRVLTEDGFLFCRYLVS